MKSFQTLLLAACAATLLSTSVALECTTGDMAKIGQLAQDPAFVKACSSFASSTDFTSMDYCSDPKCVAYMKTLIPKLPKCEVSGISLATAMQVGLDACNSGGSLTTTRPTTTKRPTIPSTPGNDSTTDPVEDTTAPQSPILTTPGTTAPASTLSPVSGGTPATSAPAPGLFPQIKSDALTFSVSAPVTAVVTLAAWHTLA